MKTANLLMVVGVLLATGKVDAAGQSLSCNLLGREIALRAAEELKTGMDATMRSQLAGIAEAVCLDYQNALEGEAASAAAAQSADDNPARDQLEKDDSGLFDLKVIDPEDRVRRPGLKRR